MQMRVKGGLFCGVMNRLAQANIAGTAILRLTKYRKSQGMKGVKHSGALVCRDWVSHQGSQNFLFFIGAQNDHAHG